MPRVLVLYYSMYGNVYRMAQEVAAGVDEVDGAEAAVRTVPELVPESVIAGNEAVQAAKREQINVPVAEPDELPGYDAIIVGTPTRFGNMTAQMRNFWDRTGGLWVTGALVGKPGAAFTSTSTLHGGQETTILTTMLTLLHHGMILVGVPYTVPEVSSTTSGGTPYGPSHTSGPQSDRPMIDAERVICRALGHRVAELAAKLAS